MKKKGNMQPISKFSISPATVTIENFNLATMMTQLRSGWQKKFTNLVQRIVGFDIEMISTIRRIT